MTAWLAFMRKEFLESVRTGKMVILLLIFLLFGIMNPAIAKLTPWLMETMAESLADTGLSVTAVEVNAMTSWTQFYKNVPMALIIFLLMYSGTMTGEYQKGTLINMLTKGLARWKVLTAKAFTVLVFWTAGYWLCYGITYGYNLYFWDNSMVSCPAFPAFCVYLLGVWLVSLILLGSVIFRTNTAALGVAGGGFILVYLLSFIPLIQEYLPVRLLSASGLLTGAVRPPAYAGAIAAASLLSAFNLAAAVICFNRKPVL